MAIKPVVLYSGTSGLNTTLDPQRLSQGTEDDPGRIELAQAVNVSIDDRGLVTLRKGYVSAQAGSFHSLFCNDGDCFVVQERTSDAAIFKVNTDYTLTGVRSGLTKGQRMCWSQVQDLAYYGNGVESGVIQSAVSGAWGVDTYNGPDASLTFRTSVPIPTDMDYDGAGVLALANGRNLYWNRLPFLFGLFAQRDVITFPTPITMIKSVPGGWYVSDEQYVRFFPGPTLHATAEQRAADTPAHSGGAAYRLLDAKWLGLEGGLGAIWSATDGIWFGTATGQAINLTREKIKYPSSYSQGACLVYDHEQIINTVY